MQNGSSQRHHRSRQFGGVNISRHSPGFPADLPHGLGLTAVLCLCIKLLRVHEQSSSRSKITKKYPGVGQDVNAPEMARKRIILVNAINRTGEFAAAIGDEHEKITRYCVPGSCRRHRHIRNYESPYRNERQRLAQFTDAQTPANIGKSRHGANPYWRAFCVSVVHWSTRTGSVTG